MLHRWNMYVNGGERKIPRLVDSGRIELSCQNPHADSYRHIYNPDPLWQYLQNESDLSEAGLYLSVSAIERPTYDGKRWFIRTAFNSTGGRLHQELTREVSWQNTKGIQFWNTSFRTYAEIHQVRSIMDYSLHVSRCFGYCFLAGRVYDDEDGEFGEFTNFYPSIHHYHVQVAINESETYQPFDVNAGWYPKDYNLNIDIQDTVVDEAADLGQAIESASEELRTWASSVEGVDLGELLTSDEEEED